MNRILSLLISSCIALCGGAASGFTAEAKAASSLVAGCKSSYLMDADSGKCIYCENETARMPIASVCKVMTLTLLFEAAENGIISYGDTVIVSENASGMGGSQVFLEGNKPYKIDQLAKSIVVCSANDSCVAVAETLCGSEEEFVAKMNKRAEELGCTDTLFSNCTGLPKEAQYSCARDVGIMFANLIGHEKYFEYSKIWLEDFVHPDERTTVMTNTNKLIKKYAFCDGGKTGFTNDAGFCLAATAFKNNLRLVSVVLGGATSDDRFNSTINMFEYGFANYKNKIVLDKDVTLNDEFAVRGGKKQSVLVKPERNSYVFSSVSESPDITFKVTAYEVKAPVILDGIVGKIEVFSDGVLCDTVNIVAAEEVEKADFGDYFRIISGEWGI